jgi:hypothetical protein
MMNKIRWTLLALPALAAAAIGASEADACVANFTTFNGTVNTQVACGPSPLGTSTGTNQGAANATVNINYTGGSSFASVQTFTAAMVPVGGCSAADPSPDGLPDTDINGCSTARRRRITVN